MKNQNDLEKKKAQVQKKVLNYYRKVVNKVIERSDRTLKNYPDSRVATENKNDCEAELRAEKKLYQRLQLDATKSLPSNIYDFEEIE